MGERELYEVEDRHTATCEDEERWLCHCAAVSAALLMSLATLYQSASVGTSRS